MDVPRLTIHRDASELVSELEFVWNQIKNHSPASSDSSPKAQRSSSRRFKPPTSGSDGPMKILSPMSEHDEAEMQSQRLLDEEDDAADAAETGSGKSSTRWQRKVERAMTKMSAEVAALREQITSGREWRSRKESSYPVWVGWLIWSVVRHLLVDSFILGLVLLWMRRRKDRRLEDLVRAALKLVREYVRKVLPSR